MAVGLLLTNWTGGSSPSRCTTTRRRVAGCRPARSAAAALAPRKEG